MSRKKVQKTDGLGPFEIAKIRSALRQVWHRSLARKLCVARCTDSDGFSRCQKCRKRIPSLKVDHIIPCGEVDEGHIKRLFCPSKGLQGLCHECHKVKTKGERADKRAATAKRDNWGF